MEIYSYEVVANGFMVFIGAVGVVSLIGTLIITWRNVKKPYDERRESYAVTMREHSEKLDRDWEALQELKGEMGLLLHGQMLLLQHGYTNNHKDKLKEHHELLQRYLIDHRSE